MRYLIFAILALGLLAQPVLAQSPLAETLAGKAYPLTMKLGDFDNTWLQVNVAVQSNDVMQFFRTIAAMERDGMPDTTSACITRGQTVVVGAETFLVAYQIPGPQLDVDALMQMGNEDGDIPEPPPPITAASELTLTLVNMRAIGSMRDARPFDMKTAIEKGSIDPFAGLRRRAARNKSLNNLRQLATALQAYAQEHNETLPDAKTWAADIAVDEAVRVHPTTKEPYVYNEACSGVGLAGIERMEVMPLIYEANPDEEGMRNVGYVDGHVETLPDARFKQVLARAKPLSAEERGLIANLRAMRLAITHFHANMGEYPKSLKDLVAPNAKALSTRYKNPQNYGGPYLPAEGGIPIPGYPGVPVNPLVKPGAPGYAIAATHWNYTPQTGKLLSRITGRLSNGKRAEGL